MYKGLYGDFSDFNNFHFLHFFHRNSYVNPRAEQIEELKIEEHFSTTMKINDHLLKSIHNNNIDKKRKKNYKKHWWVLMSPSNTTNTTNTTNRCARH